MKKEGFLFFDENRWFRTVSPGPFLIFTKEQNNTKEKDKQFTKAKRFSRQERTNHKRKCSKNTKTQKAMRESGKRGRKQFHAEARPVLRIRRCEKTPQKNIGKNNSLSVQSVTSSCGRDDVVFSIPFLQKKKPGKVQKKNMRKNTNERGAQNPQNPNQVGTLLYTIQQFLFPKGGFAAFFMEGADIDKGQKPYYNDTRMQRELQREAERKDGFFDLYT